jgi:hypothetical protein
MECSRRVFLGGAASTLVMGNAGWAAERRPKIAALTTIYHKYSHSQHIVDRFLDGYGWEGQHHHPPMDVVSLYVEQVGQNDLSRERAQRHPLMKIYPTIAEALTLGGSTLAVDGVLLVGEHGQYPRNEKRQVLYPRYEYFKQVVDVYRGSGKTAPLFNDKHLSWSWDHAQEMVNTAKSMGFGLMAGSSLPVTWRQPSIDLPPGAEVEEAVGIWNGGIDGGDIHVIEALQSIVERRRGGETGVRAGRGWLGPRSARGLPVPEQPAQSGPVNLQSCTPHHEGSPPPRCEFVCLSFRIRGWPEGQHHPVPAQLWSERRRRRGRLQRGRSPQGERDLFGAVLSALLQHAKLLQPVRPSH